MIKKRFISMLVLLMTAVTGAWADTTVTWTASDMSGIYIDFLDGEAYNNTIKGITVTSSGGGGAGDGWDTDIYLYGGSTTITFTSSVGKIKSIAIKASIDMGGTPSGWTTDYNSELSWSGEEASTTVSLPLSGGTEITDISEIVFTIESTVAVTGVTLAPTTATLTLGETEKVTLTATVLPNDATDKSVTWSSSNEAVATVTDGVVTAVAAGEATITVTTTDGAKTATCAVTVAAPAASTYTVTLKEGTEDADNWTITPAEATTTGVAAGTEVKATYGGAKKVKSVKAKKMSPIISLSDRTKLDDELVIADGYIVTGSAVAYSCKVAVADGATVTLRDVENTGYIDGGSTTCPGIRCIGDATIILEGDNTVTGGDTYAGIYVPEGKTLTIRGTGSLTVTGGSGGAGIGGNNGGNCGSIVISGGTITATGGTNGGAGIGLGNSPGCEFGDITISGGTVTATGNDNAPGIGGPNAYFRNITITDDVTKVTVNKGSYSTYSIGTSEIDDMEYCGAITIGGTVYLNEGYFENDGDSYLQTSPLVYQP